MSEAWGAVTSLLDGALRDGLFTGCGLCVLSADGNEHFCDERGLAELRPRRRPVVADQPWDLASLTKVLGTTPVVLSMVADGALGLQTELRGVLGRGPPGVSVADCLCHGSGLPAWLPLFDLAAGRPWGSDETRAWALDTVLATPPLAAPGLQHVYSDLGFLSLCALVEHVEGERLDAVWRRRVGEPSGADLRWGWPGAAATEDCPVRGRVVVGDVHDLNAAVLGGVAGHAGLFGPVRQVARAAAWQLRAWLGSAGQGLDPAVVRRFWSHRGPGSHHLGWDGVTPGVSSAGPRWPLDGVGHLAFTGCSLWIAPRQGVVVAFTSNRVHPLVEGGSRPGTPDHPRYAAFKRLRPRLFTAVVESLEAEGLAW